MNPFPWGTWSLLSNTKLVSIACIPSLVPKRICVSALWKSYTEPVVQLLPPLYSSASLLAYFRYFSVFFSPSQLPLILALSNTSPFSSSLLWASTYIRSSTALGFRTVKVKLSTPKDRAPPLAVWWDWSMFLGGLRDGPGNWRQRNSRWKCFLLEPRSLRNFDLGMTASLRNLKQT